MQFAFFIPYFREGGVETTTYRLAEELQERGHKVDLLTFGHDSPYLGADSPFHVINLGASRTLFSIPALIRYLRREQPDAMLSTHYFANLASVLARALSQVDVHTILTERLYVSHIIQQEPWPKSRLFPILMRLIYPFADDCVTVSKAAADDLRELADLPDEQVTAIYNPTLIDEVFEKADADVDHPWFHEDIPVILGVGRLADQKDFSTLVNAFDKLLDRRDARLLILGEGPNRGKLETLVEERELTEVVDLYGYAENPYAFMREAELFVLSSRYEGMPNVLVEAAALGVPVVATDCPSGPRELLDGGKGGELVPVGNPESIMEGMDQQLSDLEKAKKRIKLIQPKLEQFKPDVACSKYLELVTGEHDISG